MSETRPPAVLSVHTNQLFRQAFLLLTEHPRTFHRPMPAMVFVVSSAYYSQYFSSSDAKNMLVPQDSLASPSFFLNLPSQIRARIYHHVHILTDPDSSRFINLGNRKAPDRNHDRQRFVNTHKLMSSCRTIYDEISRQLYAANHFFARPDDYGGLNMLRALRPNSLGSLKWLTVHLNLHTCGLGDRCGSCLYPWERDSSYNYDRFSNPLSLAKARDKAIIDEWRWSWESTIAPHLSQANHLTLNLVCDVVDVETGLAVVQPFVGELQPSLAACSIRLSHGRNKGLCDLARKVVQVSTWKNQIGYQEGDSPACTFRFLDLPDELREKILSYTDLVTPFREVEWNPQHGLYHRYKFIGGSGQCFPQRIHGDPTSRTIKQLSRARTSYLGCWENSYPHGCFCKAYHAADSTAFRCGCWAPPTSYFLVNQEMRRNAIRVFFNYNRFVVAPTGGITWTGVDFPPDRLPVSNFLSSVMPTDALCHLRFLEIVFPAIGVTKACAYCPMASAQWNEWDATIQRVSKHLNLPKLTIRVYFAEWQPRDPIAPVPEYRSTMDLGEAKKVLAKYFDILAPLKRLTGLAKLFVHLSDPTAWAEDLQGSLDLEEMEMRLEKSVMGDQYDATAHGKSQIKESRWLEDSDIHGLFGASID